MLTKFHAKNFQSLKDVEVDLDRFTVIVGASSSGKSAFVRALKTAVSNPRSSSFVTYGEKFASLTTYTDSGASVLFEKGEGHGKYVVTDSSGDKQEYTKLGGDVPDAVTAAFQISPVETGKQSLNFAGQFDRPYLLDDSGSIVARVLGELTNVTRIFDAVREANRRKQNFTGLVRTRKDDLLRLTEKKQGFSSLRVQLESIEQAEAHLSKVQELDSKASQLRRVVTDLGIAESYLERTAVPLIVPDLSPVLAARDRLDAYTSLIADIRATATKVKDASLSFDVSVRQGEAKKEELHKVLLEAGTCPTCDQPIT